MVDNTRSLDGVRSTAKRRSFLKLAGVAGIGAFAGCLGDDDGVTYGFNGPTSGPLAPDGQEQQMGFELAIDHLNNGGGLVDEWDQLDGDGVLGDEITQSISDSEADADASAENIERMIDADDIVFWTGGVSSAVTMEGQRIAEREEVVFQSGNSTSSAISGENCSKFYFHHGMHAETIGLAAAEGLPELIGDDANLFHIYMDYSYGHSNRDAMRKHLTEDGPWTDVGESPIPNDEDDHSSQISDLEAADADVVHFASFGDFAAAGLSQMQDAGVLDDVEVFIPHVSAFSLDPMGDAREGVYGAVPWNPFIDDDNAQTFVDAYQDEYGEMPTQNSFHGYDTALVYSAAVEEAGTWDSTEVVEVMEDFSWDMGSGPMQYRQCDHQNERQIFIVEGVTDDDADDLGHMVDIAHETEPVIYGCDEPPANDCDMP